MSTVNFLVSRSVPGSAQLSSYKQPLSIVILRRGTLLTCHPAEVRWSRHPLSGADSQNRRGAPGWHVQRAFLTGAKDRAGITLACRHSMPSPESSG